MKMYIATVAVRFEVQAENANVAREIAEEKAIELAVIVGDMPIGAFETETLTVELDNETE